MASTYVQYIPVKDEKTETTLEALLTHWNSKFGCPEVIFTDLASVFKSSEAQVFYKLLGIDHMVTAPHAHWMLGRVERKHQAPTRALKIMSREDRPYWPVVVAFVAFSENSLQSTKTGVTPNELILVEIGCDLIFVPESQFRPIRVMEVADQ